VSSGCRFLAGIVLAFALGSCGPSQETVQEPPIRTPEVKETKPPVVVETQTDTVAVVRRPPTESPTSSAADSVVQTRFYIQIGSFRNARHATKSQMKARERFPGMVTNEFRQKNGLYRIRLGSFPSFDEARKFRRGMVKQFPQEYESSWISVEKGGSQ
jgi:cell division protein FtsN